MAKIKTVTWDLEPHTRAKHEILRRYLGAWFAILSRHHKLILYVDGFAGPGEYAGGEEGSPVIALRTAAEHYGIQNNVACIFIEKDERRSKNLERVLEELKQRSPLPPNVSYRVRPRSFQEVITEGIARRAAEGKGLEPSFVFVDPFGYSDTPLSLIAQIMKYERCEVFITFMIQHLNRFGDLDDAQRAHCDELFGTPDWRMSAEIVQPAERRRFYHELYKQQLHDAAGIKYVRSFEMVDRGNQTEYFLFYGTNSLLGLSKMKEAMWKVDETGGIRFSDNTDPNQMMLLGPDADLHMLSTALQSIWSWPMDAPIEALEEWTLSETPFREMHVRKVLATMEKEKKLDVKESSREKRYSYPKGTVIQFL